MDAETRKQLGEIWAANERRIADAQELRVGAESPAELEARLDAEQDEIEHDLGLDLLMRRQEELDPPWPEDGTSQPG